MLLRSPFLTKEKKTARSTLLSSDPVYTILINFRLKNGTQITKNEIQIPVKSTTNP